MALTIPRRRSTSKEIIHSTRLTPYLVFESEHNKRVHFAAHEQPELLET